MGGGFISHALTMGTPEAVVRQWVGHVDPQVLKLYTHIADQQSKAFMDRLFSDHKKEPTAADGDLTPNDKTPEQEGGAKESGEPQDRI